MDSSSEEERCLKGKGSEYRKESMWRLVFYLLPLFKLHFSTEDDTIEYTFLVTLNIKYTYFYLHVMCMALTRFYYFE